MRCKDMVDRMRPRLTHRRISILPDGTKAVEQERIFAPAPAWLTPPLASPNSRAAR